MPSPRSRVGASRATSSKSAWTLVSGAAIGSRGYCWRMSRTPMCLLLVAEATLAAGRAPPSRTMRRPSIGGSRPGAADVGEAGSAVRLLAGVAAGEVVLDPVGVRADRLDGMQQRFVRHPE